MHGFHYHTVDSTNEQARRLARHAEARKPFYVLAREQTAGRGSRGRRWISPRDGGIYLTVVDFPPHGTAPSDAFTFAAGVAAAEVLHQATAVDVRLEPVNDLYVAGRKLGGILTETIVEAGSIDVLMTGVGINVRRADRPMPDGRANPTSLEDALAPDVFTVLDLDRLTACLVLRILSWNRVVFSGQIERVQSACAHWQKSGETHRPAAARGTAIGPHLGCKPRA